MKYGLTLVTGLLVAGVVGTTAIGDGHANKATMAAVQARQSQMTLYAFNIELLGEMAKGAVEYDAAAASAAASNLTTLIKLDQSRYWPPGSDNQTLGDEATEALPKIWEADSKVGESAKAMAEAAANMEQAAGGGLDALRGAIGPLGKACTNCHETYRKPMN